MASLNVSKASGFNSRDLWIDNPSESTGEGFADLQSSSGSVLLGEASQTYSEYSFTSGGSTYRYIGEFNVNFTGSLVSGEASSSGSYDRIEVTDANGAVAVYDGPAIAVDFGSTQTGVLGVATNLLDLVSGLLGGADGAPVENLHLDATPNLPDIAFAGNDSLVGFTGADTLYGAAGDDVINGGLGADSLTGGTGNDTYIVDNAGDVVVEGLNGGADTIQSSVSYALGANVENLVLTGAAANGFGNDLANFVRGTSGANVLNGGAGADSLSGGAGNDTYIVDNVGDVVTEGLNAGVDTVQSSVSYTLDKNIENLWLSGDAVSATGNGQANQLRGTSGANVLDGKAGADAMMGGQGNDTYIVDNAGDVVSEGANGGVDTVQSSVNHALAGNVENLTLAGATALSGTGNGLANTIVGNSAANVLNGAGGADILTGGGGADTFVFSQPLDPAGIDRITDFNAPQDTIALSSKIFLGLTGGVLADAAFSAGPVALDANDRIIYDGASGGLFFDRDGSGTAFAAQQFAILNPGLTLTASDFIVG